MTSPARDSGFARLVENGMARRVYWAKAPLTGWKVALNIPETQITGSASQLAVRTVAVAGVAVIHSGDSGVDRGAAAD